MKIFKRIIIIFIIIFIIIAISIFGFFVYQKNKTVYTAKDFGIKTIISKTDYDNDGVDDYTDILQGAKIEANNKPIYKSEYYAGGYPPDKEGGMYRCYMESIKKRRIFIKRYGR